MGYRWPRASGLLEFPVGYQHRHPLVKVTEIFSTIPGATRAGQATTWFRRQVLAPGSWLLARQDGKFTRSCQR